MPITHEDKIASPIMKSLLKVRFAAVQTILDISHIPGWLSADETRKSDDWS